MELRVLTDKLRHSQCVESLVKLHLLLAFITSEKPFHQRILTKYVRKPHGKSEGTSLVLCSSK